MRNSVFEHIALNKPRVAGACGGAKLSLVRLRNFVCSGLRCVGCPVVPVLRQAAFRIALLFVVCGALLLAGNISSAEAQGNRPRRNPLGELFRNLDRGIRQGAEEIEQEKFGRDQLDLRPVQRSEDHRRLRQATDLIEEKRWHNATEVLQYLLDQPSDAYSISETREFLSLQTEVDRMIGSLPPEGLRYYVNRYSVPAEQLLQKALEAQDNALLMHVASRFFYTPAGQSALEVLAKNWQDQGEFGRAAEAWLRLMNVADEPEQQQFRRAAVWALSQANRKDEAIEIARRMPDADQLLRDIHSVTTPDIPTDEGAGPYVGFSDAIRLPTDPEPIPLPRWSVNLVERYSVESRIATLASDLREQGRALLPTIQPIAVDGKLAYRSLRSLQVREIKTGRLLWERRMQRSPEELLSRGNAENGFDDNHLNDIDERLFEQSHLTSLLYRDEVYSSMSSDGSRLFCVETSGETLLTAPLQVWRHRDDGADAEVAWETNELTAYDLNTGQIRWRVGGAEIEKQFSRPLAGTCFFGAPAVDGGELYLIGERKEEVSLYCLSAQTGELHWSQPLAEPGRPLAEDILRRHWTCRPVIADGVILCPTSCGWMTAIDLVTHRLKWACRYAPRMDRGHQFRGGYSMQTIQELNRRWEDVVTVVSNGKALVTPPEMPNEFGTAQPLLFCIDVQTGNVLWEQQKTNRSGGTGLYLAGVWQNQAIIVGTHSVIARNVEQDGEILWSVTLTQRPSGRGIIVNDKLLLPVTEKKLLTIDLDSAKIENVMMPSIASDLGNLKLHQGQLIALSYRNAIVFPAMHPTPQEESDPELVVRRQLRESKLLLANGHFEEYVAALQPLYLKELLSPSIKQEVTDALRTGLLHLLPRHPADEESLLILLDQLSKTAQQQRDFQRMQADYLKHAGKFEAALNAYLEILTTFPLEERVTEETREVRIDGWVGGRLKELHQTHDQGNDRETFVAAVASRIQKLDEDPIVRDRWARALAFHPLGLELELQLAKQSLKDGETAAAVLRLQRVTEGPDVTLRTRALLLLGQTLEHLGWHADALTYWRRLQSEPDLTLADGLKTHLLARVGMESAQAALSKQKSPGERWRGSWSLERVGVSGNERRSGSVPFIGHGLQRVQALQLQLESDSERIRVSDQQSGKFLASFPVRSLSALEHNPNMGGRLLGPLAIVMNQGVLHLFAWPDQKVLWTWSPDLKGLALTRLAIVQAHVHAGLRSVAQFMAGRQFQSSQTRTGYLLAANSRAVLLRCKDWIALDPLTGEELWRDHDASDRSTAFELGSDAFLTTARSGRKIRHVIDGRMIVNTDLDEFLERMLVIDDHEFLSFRRSTRRTNGRPAIEVLRVSVTGEVRWSVEIPGDALMSMPNERSIVWLSSDHEMNILNLTDGKNIGLGKIAVAQGPGKTNVSVMADNQRYYVFVDSGDTQPTYVNLPSIRFAGQILAFDSLGQLLWEYQTPFIQSKAKIPGQTSDKTLSNPKNPKRRWPLNVLIQDFKESPLLLLVGDRVERQGDMFLHQLCVLGLDKATGEPLIDWQRPSESGGFSYLEFDPEQRKIELRTYNERLQMKLDDGQSALAEPLP